jgi:hypothetical protein
LSLSIATVVMGTAGLNHVSPVFAGGDEKKCKNNDNNNCNNTERNQKVSARDECENETTVKHHSDDNDIDNILICSIDAANLRETGLVNSTVFGDLLAPEFQ